MFSCSKNSSKSYLLPCLLIAVPQSCMRVCILGYSPQLKSLKKTETHCCYMFFFSFFLFCFKNIYLFLVALGLHCCARAFSSCGEWGLLSSFGAWAFHFGGFSCGAQASVAVVHRLSCSVVAGGIFLDQGSNSCPLHQQADSQPLDRQGSPGV